MALHSRQRQAANVDVEADIAADHFAPGNAADAFNDSSKQNVLRKKLSEKRRKANRHSLPLPGVQSHLLSSGL